MAPGGAGRGLSPYDAASDFDKIIAYSWSFEPNAVIDVIMASGTYNLSVNQDFDLSPESSAGKRYVFNYGDACNINVNISGYMYFHKYSFTPPTSYEFRDINFVSTNSYAMFVFDANAGTRYSANSIRKFYNCSLTSAPGAYMFPPTLINGEIDLNQCTCLSQGYPVAMLSGSVVMNVIGSTCTNTGTYPCIQLGNGLAGDTLVFTAQGSTFNEPNASALTYVFRGTLVSTPVLNLIDCNITANPLGYGTGIYIVSPVWTYIKHTNISTPSSAILQHSQSSNVLIDDCNLDANAPTRLTVGGTWAAGDTIQVWVQKVLQISSFTYTVQPGLTSAAQVAADFAAAWDANADSFCQTITASSSDVNIILSGTSAWQTMTPVVNGVVGGTSSLGGTIINMADFEYMPYGSVKLPFDPVVFDGNNVLIKNCNVHCVNGMAWEGINANGITYGGGVTIQNCFVKDAFFPIVCRADNALVDGCVAQGNWPYLVESGASSNTIKNSTLYCYPSPVMNTGVFTTGSSAKAVNNSSYNNIAVVNTALINMGSGNLPTSIAYCIYDYQNYIGGNYFENNCYWTIGANAKLAKLSTIDYTTLAGILSAWPVVGVNTMSSLNDLHSIYADPQFADMNNGDFSLLPGSPCIGAGIPYLGGDKSFIGAVPPKAGSTPSDLDANGRVDFVDFAIFAQHWLEGVEP